MKDIKDYITEAIKVDVPLSEIIDSDGRSLAHLPYFEKPENYWKHSRYEFEFSTAREMKDFLDTTESRDFWMAIYDYDSLNMEKNDFTEIAKWMRTFGNLSGKKSVIIYVFHEEFLDELKQHCEKAKETHAFKSVKFVEV